MRKVTENPVLRMLVHGIGAAIGNYSVDLQPGDIVVVTVSIQSY